MRRKIIPDVIREQKVAWVEGYASVRAAARLMREHNVILEEAGLKGILTVNDIAYCVVAEGRDPEKTPVRQVMTQDPDSVTAGTLAIEALRLMHEGGYRHLPVVEDGRILGLVSRRDFYGEEKARLEVETALWERIG